MDSRVICKLENGLKGVIDRINVSDQLIEPKDAIVEGQSLICRVIDIDKPRFEVALSSKGSDLRSDLLYHNSVMRLGLETIDPYLIPDNDFEDDEDVDGTRPKRTSSEPARDGQRSRRSSSASSSSSSSSSSRSKGDPCKNRRIDHPLFKPLSYKEAEDYLAAKVCVCHVTLLDIVHDYISDHSSCFNTMMLMLGCWG